ncbi:MAG: DegT/DnrJ/EryC1/StrS family aminotransferase, partial [Pseudanabaena sp. LacPavin_0818_WC45_MAG_42_6]|nr:DegT/DnrJ/EryC1/StrS family aminotransferase [Pseudanabaena sp. LacPavin_0818_WC45_MAG_42_6]
MGKLTEKDTDALRGKILDLTSEFARQSLGKSEFVAGETPVPVSGKVLSPEDFVSLVDSSLDGWLTAGKHTKLFEKQLADFVGARSALFVNSGSSANLCALSG